MGDQRGEQALVPNEHETKYCAGRPRADNAPRSLRAVQ